MQYSSYELCAYPTTSNFEKIDLLLESASSWAFSTGVLAYDKTPQRFLFIISLVLYLFTDSYLKEDWALGWILFTKTLPLLTLMKNLKPRFVYIPLTFSISTRASSDSSFKLYKFRSKPQRFTWLNWSVNLLQLSGYTGFADNKLKRITYARPDTLHGSDLYF